MEDLAAMVNKGFEGVDVSFAKLEKKLEKKIENAKNELKVEINKKVDIFAHNDLKFRVEKVEEKVGIAKKH